MAEIQSIEECPPFPVVEGVEFRHIPNWIGYAAESTGRVWSCVKTGRYWKQLSHRVHNGYIFVGIINVATRKLSTRQVHALVCSAFHGPKPEGMECCHNDGTRDNNSPGNLRWDTRSNNLLDAVRQGVYGHPGRYGDDASYKKLTSSQVSEIRAIGRTMTMKALGSRFGVSASQVCNILQGKSRKRG